MWSGPLLPGIALPQDPTRVGGLGIEEPLYVALNSSHEASDADVSHVKKRGPGGRGLKPNTTAHPWQACVSRSGLIHPEAGPVYMYPESDRRILLRRACLVVPEAVLEGRGVGM